jgi:hypothetical protein
MLGIQSLGGFMNLYVNAKEIARDNQKLALTTNCLIKNGLIVNSGVNPTKESRLQLIEDNRRKYSLTEDQIDDLVDEEEFFALKRERRIEFTEFLEDKLSTNPTKIEDSTGVDKKIDTCKKRLRKLQGEYFQSVHKIDPSDEFPFEIIKEDKKIKKVV